MFNTTATMKVPITFMELLCNKWLSEKATEREGERVTHMFNTAATTKVPHIFMELPCNKWPSNEEPLVDPETKTGDSV
jgi:hypothetical protein